MTQTYYLDSVSDLQDVYDSVAEDLNETDYASWMADELVRMSDLHKGYFQKQTGPDGAAWPRNAPSTIRRKGHSRIMRGHPKNNYRLSRSLTERATSTTGDAVREMIQTDSAAHIAFGTTVEYSMHHDQARGNIPARRHVGINDRHLDGMVNRVADHIIKELAK